MYAMYLLLTEQLYVNQQWIDSGANRVFQLTCFPSRFQEPYDSSLFFLSLGMCWLRTRILLCYLMNDLLTMVVIKYSILTISDSWDISTILLPMFLLRILSTIRFLLCCDMICRSAYREKFNYKFSSNGRPDMTIVCFRYLEQLAKAYGKATDVLPICVNKHFVSYDKVRSQFEITILLCDINFLFVKNHVQGRLL